jgi:hypothetical protein
VRWAFAFSAVLLAVICLIGALFFSLPDPEEPILFGSSVAILLIVGGLISWRRWDAQDEEYLRAHPDISPPIPWLGVSIGLLAYSLEVGWWLSLIAGGMIVFGIGGLVRERRAQRAALRRGLAQATWEGHRR